MTARRKHRNEHRQIRALRDALDVYASGRSGIQFDALIRFAGPIFDLYDVDWRAGEEVDVARRDREELSTMVSILDTARLLWAFFSLDDEKNLEMLPDLEDVLIGKSAGDEERSNLLVLLSLMEEHWQTFSIQERSNAEDTPGFALPEFEDLLEEFKDRTDQFAVGAAGSFGPDELDLPEAIALFAQPLLESPGVEGDPDRLEEQIARAQAYWELAQVSNERFEQELARIQDSFASSDAERENIRRQANEMLSRFRKLFPDSPEGNS